MNSRYKRSGSAEGINFKSKVGVRKSCLQLRGVAGIEIFF